VLLLWGGGGCSGLGDGIDFILLIRDTEAVPQVLGRIEKRGGGGILIRGVLNFFRSFFIRHSTAMDPRYLGFSVIFCERDSILYFSYTCIM